MAYPKPLSTKLIDKMFASWDPHTVEVLHTYYAAFSALYGSIQLQDAWEIFKEFEPKIRKKQFIEFSSIVRREDVSYYIYEIDEIYSDEKRADTQRFIINKELIRDGYGKFVYVYDLHEAQAGKPYYDRPDLLEVAANRHFDKDLRPFINRMKFTKGKQKGKRFDEAVFLNSYEKFSLEYYKSESKRQKIKEKALIPFSKKLMKYMERSVEFFDDPFRAISEYFNDNGYVFESPKQAEKFFSLFTEYINNSHLWRNCGFTPIELRSVMNLGLPKSISFGPGIKKAFEDGDIDRDELIEKIKEMGIDVID